MFKNLLDCVSDIRKLNGSDVIVEELIDAPYFSLEKYNGEVKSFKSNGSEISDDDVLLNSMYGDIRSFSIHLSEKIEGDFYASFFYFPTEKPRGIAYPKYKNKFMLSQLYGDTNQEEIFNSDDRILKFTPKLSEYKLTDIIIDSIEDCVNNREHTARTAMLLSDSVTKIKKDRTNTKDMEGLVIRIGKKIYKFIINKRQDKLDVSERKMSRDIILKDFCKWYYSDHREIPNDTYQNIISWMFIHYINNTDIIRRYDLEPEYLKPPMIGYIGEMSYDMLENETVADICKHNECMGCIYKIIYSALRKHLVRHEGDILTDTDVNQWNIIVDKIKAEEI